jgi:hypothetical protein
VVRHVLKCETGVYSTLPPIHEDVQFDASLGKLVVVRWFEDELGKHAVAASQSAIDSGTVTREAMDQALRG